ncbi:MAG: LysR family transcriptional regulator [Candidatus Fonsibacter sp.]|nr:LysR family transcriptional regulator [Pelagibacterales bacterium]
MNWEKLKIFHKVAKAGSFLQASKQENRSQSTFSRAIIDLEKDIKHKIFTRNPRGVKLTKEGNDLLNLIEDFSIKLERYKNTNGKT